MSRPIHVLVDGEIYALQDRGGISNYVTELLLELRHVPGVAVELLVPETVRGAIPSGDAIRRRRRALISPTRWLVSNRLSYTFRSVRDRLERAAWRACLLKRAQVLYHSSYYTAFALRTIPHIVTVYDMMPERLPEEFATPSDARCSMEKLESISTAYHIIAISDHTKIDVCDICGIPESRVSVVHLGVNHEVFQPDPMGYEIASLEKFCLRRPYFFCVGGRWGYKNFYGLATGFARAKLSDTFELILLGSRWRAEEVDLLNKLSLTNSVRLIGNPDDLELAVLYRSAAVFVYPSLYEGFGLPILEAMACGTPVAASGVSSIPEVAGSAACLFDPRDPDSIAQSLLCVLDSQRARRCRELGIERAKTFSWRRTAQETAKVYGQVFHR